METSSRSSNKETKDDYRGDIVYIYIYNQASEKYRYEERKVTGECAS
jgi:hypothetical protein